MSTESATRRGRMRKRRGRVFTATFAVVVAVLAAAGLAGAAASVAQGPRVTDVQVDPAAAAQASGARLIITTSQSLAEVDAAQVTVTPAAPFSVDTAGRSMGLRFELPLHDDTEYTVRFDGVSGVGGGPAATITETFRTPPAEVHLLQRSDTGDTIFRTDLTGEEAVPVFQHEHIEDFRATFSHLVVSVREDDQASLLITDLEGGSERALPLPGDGYVTNLQAADRGELIGYTFSDADLGEAGGLESTLFTASLKENQSDAAPTQIAVGAEESRVVDWRFVPDTDSILLITFDGSLLLTGADGEQATALGDALSIDGVARGSSEAIVTRTDGPTVIDLADATESPLVPPDAGAGRPGPVTPVPGGGTVRVAATLDDLGMPVATTVTSVDEEGRTAVLMDVAPTDAVLKTCISPSGRYAAILLAPDVVDNRYDTYQMPMPARLQTHVVEIADGTEVVALSGFGISWCQVPPR